MDPFTMAALGSAAIGGVASIFNTDQQSKQLDFNKTQAALTMSREDNAVQRRVADLKAAGLSPILAAGSAASSQSSQVSTAAPQFDASAAMSPIATTMAMQQLHNQTQLTTAQASIAKHDAGVIKNRPNTLSTDPWQARIIDQGAPKVKQAVKDLMDKRESKISAIKDRWKNQKISDPLLRYPTPYTGR